MWEKKMRKRSYGGTTNPEVTRRETENRALSRRAAAEGVVLLKNEGLLPLKKNAKVAVYGRGVAKIIKGGTGSGDVNEREVVSLLDGLLAADFTVVNENAARTYMEEHEAARQQWRRNVFAKMDEISGSSDMSFFEMLAGIKPREVEEIPILEKELSQADAAVYIVSRVAGEGRDRKAQEGDYLLTQQELQQIEDIEKYQKNIILLINTGGQIDVTGLVEKDSVRAVIYLSQPGMEAGNVAADILSGRVTPSGRLTTTWVRDYQDFPNAKTFSHCNGNVDQEFYREGIYVGYRYFDSFGVKPLYPFGYGLTYTSFEQQVSGVRIEGNDVMVSVRVTNTGNVYSGKETVQIYAACPQCGMEKELKRLAGFGKTKTLTPGETETVEVRIWAKELASYDEKQSAWMLCAGNYYLLLGEDCARVHVAGVLKVETDRILERLKPICLPKEELEEIHPDSAALREQILLWEQEARAAGLEAVSYAPAETEIVCHTCAGKSDASVENAESEGSGRDTVARARSLAEEMKREARSIAERMTDEELTAMLMGEITKGQDNIRENELVETGMYIPGAAGETSCRFEETYGVPAISMADGPAGLRLMRKYDVDNSTGKIYGYGLLSSLEGGILARDTEHEDSTAYYMYATAIPIGTLLAQTWNPSLLREIGEMIAGEMQEFGISWWLAPGMNIHRNPLCGRNFEYYSEDPLIAGVMAAAITGGVQALPGVGTTIKHFACNNQEDNRMYSDSIVSQRALREIYLRGFEIAVKTSQPMCIMTSYNKINGVPTANSEELIMDVARGEWGFGGIVMTDWTTTTSGCAIPHRCAIAGNDLIMPGNQIDIDDITKALASGELPREKAVDCATRLITMIFATLGMENARPYGERWGM